MSHHQNVARIKTVLSALGDLGKEVVFVGGATISFYADEQSFEVRETDDVDIIIEVLTYPKHAKLEERLLALGFMPVVDSKVRCRYKIRGVTVDIMPTTNVMMGFENQWYPDGFHNAITKQIDSTTTIKILSPPHFIATKLEAFKSRGRSEGRTSHDFEDIVYILENRASIWKEMDEASSKLKLYLKSEFSTLMKHESIYEWIDCHVEMVSPPSTDFIIEELKKFISKDSGKIG